MSSYNGADVNARDKHKHTPLHYASKKASADVIKVLVDAGADDEEKTPQSGEAQPQRRRLMLTALRMT